MKKNKVAPIVDRAHSIWATENKDDYPRIQGKLQSLTRTSLKYVTPSEGVPLPSSEFYFCERSGLQ